MARNDMLLDLMYRGTTTMQEFNWDMMTTTPMLQLISPDDIEYIRKTITSPKYSGNLKYRLNTINDVMHTRGFTKLAGGTNRVVYTHPLAPNAVFKVAIDSIGIKDNPAEYYNQQFLKPYCTKVFECSTCGTIASFERVERMTTFEEFYSIADDYYYLISKVILGKYIMEDIGIDYFMNIGIRKGNGKFCGPVLLDFPYLYELDGRKLICDATLDDGTKCYGEIDYDAGFNKLVCTKCGRRFRAHELAKPPESRGILIRSKGAGKMKFSLVTKSGKVVKTINTNEEREYLSKPITKKEDDKNMISNNGIIKVIRKTVVKKEDTTNVSTAKNTVVNNKPIVEENKQQPSKKVVIKHINVSMKHDNDEDKTVYKDTEGKIKVNLICKTVKVDRSSNKPQQHKKVVNNTPIRKEETIVPKNSVVKRVVAVSIGKVASPNAKVNTETSENPAVKVKLTTVKKENAPVNTNVIKRAGKPVTLDQMAKDFADKKEDTVKRNIKYVSFNVKTNDAEVEKAIAELDIKTEEVVEPVEEVKTVVESNVVAVEEAKEVEQPAEVVKDQPISTNDVVTSEEVDSDIANEIASDDTNNGDYTEESAEDDLFRVIITTNDIDNSGLNEYDCVAFPKENVEGVEIYEEKMMRPYDIDLKKYDVYIYLNGDFNEVEKYDAEKKVWHLVTPSDDDESAEDGSEDTTSEENQPSTVEQNEESTSDSNSTENVVAEETAPATTVEDNLEDDSALEALAASVNKPSVEDLMK